MFASSGLPARVGSAGRGDAQRTMSLFRRVLCSTAILTGEQTVKKARLLGVLPGIALGCSLVFAGDPAPTLKIPVALTFHAPAAKSIAVAGSFDPWWQKLHPMKKDAKGRWLVVLDLAPGRYEFHFLVDGEWRHDPRQTSVDDGLGSRNNVLVVYPSGL